MKKMAHRLHRLSQEPLTKMVKKQIIKSFVGSRGGFSKEPLAAGGIKTIEISVNLCNPWADKL
jgi:hypothetical protein